MPLHHITSSLCIKASSTTHLNSSSIPSSIFILIKMTLIFRRLSHLSLFLLILIATFVVFSTAMDPKEIACRQICGHRFVRQPRGGVRGRFFGFKQTSGSESRESWEETYTIGEKFGVPGYFEKGFKNSTKNYGSSTRTSKDTIQYGFL